nr:v-type proton atpase 16 kda proteolipid subunit 2 [Quercus suber]
MNVSQVQSREEVGYALSDQVHIACKTWMVCSVDLIDSAGSRTFLSPLTLSPTTLPALDLPVMAEEVQDVLNPKFAPFLGMGGIAFAMIFGCMGAAYGTAKSGIGISGVGTFRSDLIMKSLIPVVMSGIIAVYALVVAVLIAGNMQSPSSNNTYSLFQGCLHLACGLSVGLTGCGAGYAIGIVGDSGVRAYMQQSRIFVGMVLILIFGEVLGLYGLIVALILNTRAQG